RVALPVGADRSDRRGVVAGPGTAYRPGPRGIPDVGALACSPGRCVLDRSGRSYLLRHRRRTGDRRTCRWRPRRAVARQPRGGWQRWFLPLAVAATVAWGIHLSRQFPTFPALDNSVAAGARRYHCGAAGWGDTCRPRESRRTAEPVGTPRAGRVGDRRDGHAGGPNRLGGVYGRQPVRWLGNWPAAGPMTRVGAGGPARCQEASAARSASSHQMRLISPPGTK